MLVAIADEGWDDGGEDCRVKVLCDRLLGGKAGGLASLSSSL